MKLTTEDRLLVITPCATGRRPTPGWEPAPMAARPTAMVAGQAIKYERLAAAFSDLTDITLTKKD
jgi:hypothetical protein